MSIDSDSSPTKSAEDLESVQASFLAVDEFPAKLQALPLHERSLTPNLAPRSGPVRLRATDLPIENHPDDKPHSASSSHDILVPELLTGTLVYRRPAVPEIQGPLSQRVVDYKWVIYYDSPLLSQKGPRCNSTKPRGELQFESCFECGNLACVIRVREDLYDLVLDEDTNGFGCTQWFFFMVYNMLPGQTVTFRIVNLGKSTSLYEEGQRPLILSEDDQCPRPRQADDPPWEKHPTMAWRRCGEEVGYTCTEMHKAELHGLLPNDLKVGDTVTRKDGVDQPRSKRGQMLYMLHFRVTFDGPGIAYFATALPYSFTRLQRVLRILEDDQERRAYIRRSYLCRTLSGNHIDMITITDRESKARKRNVVITARVHPGETNSSFVAEGILNFLTSDDPEAKMLRQHFTFKVVPMLNPDGVINGHYRSNMLGVDLNRRWRCASKKLHPSIWHTKNLIRRLQDDDGVAVYIDLHGHSRRLDWFCYGCRTHDTGTHTVYDPLVLPSAIRLRHPQFNLNNCSFTVQHSKDQTARVTVWREMKVSAAYTIEISLAGTSYSVGTNVASAAMVRHFHCFDYFSMAQAICRALTATIPQPSFDGETGEAARELTDTKANVFLELSEDIKQELEACLTREHVPDSESDGELTDDGKKRSKKRRKRFAPVPPPIRTCRSAPVIAPPQEAVIRVPTWHRKVKKKIVFAIRESRTPSKTTLEIPDMQTEKVSTPCSFARRVSDPCFGRQRNDKNPSRSVGANRVVKKESLVGKSIPLVYQANMQVSRHASLPNGFPIAGPPCSRIMRRCSTPASIITFEDFLPDKKISVPSFPIQGRNDFVKPKSHWFR